MIYVDGMRAKFGRLVLCHMLTDGEDEELHQMADRIGVSRRWFQGDHYDIALSKRKLALASGAREITHDEYIAWFAERRRRVGLGTRS